MNQLSIKYHLFLKDNDYILILQDCSQSTLDIFLHNYYNSVDIAMASDSSILRPSIGIGDYVLSLSQLSFSYSDASYALIAAKAMNKDYLYFNNLVKFNLKMAFYIKEMLQLLNTSADAKI